MEETGDAFVSARRIEAVYDWTTACDSICAWAEYRQSPCVAVIQSLYRSVKLVLHTYSLSTHVHHISRYITKFFTTGGRRNYASQSCKWWRQTYNVRCSIRPSKNHKQDLNDLTPPLACKSSHSGCTKVQQADIDLFWNYLCLVHKC